jgi:hypothetical protein
MSEYYDSSLLRKKPSDDRDFQAASQKQRARHSAGRGAIYSEFGLEDQYNQRQMNKALMLKKMGLQKEMTEGGQALQRESLAHSKKMSREGIDLRKDKIDYAEGQDKIATYLAAGNMALGAAMGYQQWQEQKKLTKQWDIRLGMLQFQQDEALQKKYRAGEIDYDPVGE